MTLLILITGLIFYSTERADTLKLQLLYGLSFILYMVISWLTTKRWNISLKQIIIAGVLLRILLLFDLPNLSDDYFRYTWDAHLTNTGKDPYEYRPMDYVQWYSEDTVAMELFEATNGDLKMNSKRYYSIYPTISQLIFSASLFITGSPNVGNIIMIKAILLLFELGVAWILLKILSAKGKPRSLLVWYWLNPLVIIELVGNAHFDGIAIFFLLTAYYLLEKDKRTQSAVSLAAAVATKLNPLFLAVISIRELPFKRWLLWSVLAGIFSLGMLAIFLNLHNIYHVKWSLRLYFYAFHFNSSFMNAVRGSLGRDAMELAMGFIPIVTFWSILAINLLRKNWSLSEKLILAYAIYYFFGTTLHPWYIITLIPFAIISDWKFPIAWTYLIFMTYSFYGHESVEQIGWVIGVEYGVLALFLINDLYAKIKGRSIIDLSKFIQ